MLGLVDLDGFREKVRTGWVATRIQEGGQASAHLLGSWRFIEPHYIDGNQLILEVADTIAELQRAPSSSDRCLEALDTYLADRSEESRLALRKAYLEIPEQMRHFVLGDQDYWIPAEELPRFNAAIVGEIRVVAEYRHGDRVETAGTCRD